MELYASIFEGLMILCFGVSWPVAVWKTLKTKNVSGISIFFLWFVFFGYVSGVMFKLVEAVGNGYVNPVIILYLFNLVLVGTEVILFYRYRVIPERA